MKRLIVLFVIMNMILVANAQKKITAADVPRKVMDQALQIRPEVNNPNLPIKWQREGINYKIISPGIKGMAYPSITVIDSSGTFISVEDLIDVEALPLKARDYILGRDPTAVISEAYKLLDGKFQTTYRAVVVSKPKFDVEGNLISGTANKPKEIKK